MPTFDRFRLLHAGGTGTVSGRAIVKSLPNGPETPVPADQPTPTPAHGAGSQSATAPAPLDVKMLAVALTYDRASARFPANGFYTPVNPGHFIHEAIAAVAPPGGGAGTQVWLLVGPTAANAQWAHAGSAALVRVV
jgi:hypothetical protein